jgi:hypothetical protein
VFRRLVSRPIGPPVRYAPPGVYVCLARTRRVRINWPDEGACSAPRAFGVKLLKKRHAWGLIGASGVLPEATTCSHKAKYGRASDENLTLANRSIMIVIHSCVSLIGALFSVRSMFSVGFRE